MDCMANTDCYIDWTGCELVERIPGKVSGRPIVRGTRILADTIVQDAELGSPLDEIHENYPDLPVATIRRSSHLPPRNAVSRCRESSVRPQSAAQAKNQHRRTGQSLRSSPLPTWDGAT